MKYVSVLHHTSNTLICACRFLNLFNVVVLQNFKHLTCHFLDFFFF